MYAIIQAGGNQYKVQPGETLDVDLVDKTVGDTVKYPALLVVDGDKVIVGPDAAKIEVAAKIIKHFQGEKIDVFRYKSKVRYRKRKGFRAQLTQLQIVAIGKTNYVEKPEVKPVKQEKLEKNIPVEKPVEIAKTVAEKKPEKKIVIKPRSIVKTTKTPKKTAKTANIKV